MSFLNPCRLLLRIVCSVFAVSCRFLNVKAEANSGAEMTDHHRVQTAAQWQTVLKFGRRVRQYLVEYVVVCDGGFSIVVDFLQKRNKVRHEIRASSSSSSSSGSEYKPGIFDDLFLKLFRAKMVKEVGWDSEKTGYDGLIEVANRLVMKSKSNSDTKEAGVRILISLFPTWLLELYKMLVAPLAGGKVAAIMVARVTVMTCQWLMGRCSVNSVDLPDGTSCPTGVFVEKCKYLEESKCVGICINTCKLPAQSFFNDYMGVPLLTEPNFTDYSCQFKFGIIPPLPEDDPILKESCLEICPNATTRRALSGSREPEQCPKAA